MPAAQAAVPSFPASRETARRLLPMREAVFAPGCLCSGMDGFVCCRSASGSLIPLRLIAVRLFSISRMSRNTPQARIRPTRSAVPPDEAPSQPGSIPLRRCRLTTSGTPGPLTFRPQEQPGFSPAVLQAPFAQQSFLILPQY